MDSGTRLLYWLLEATKGGPTRLKILRELNQKPANIRRISLELGMDYKTIQGHIELLAKNGVLEAQGGGYGAAYFLSAEFESNAYLKKALGGRMK